MQCYMTNLDEFSKSYIEKYKENFTMPLNTQINKGLYADVEYTDCSTTDCWDTIDAICGMVSMSRIAFVVFNIDVFFDEIQEEMTRPYSMATIPIKRTILSKDGRDVVRHIDKIMTKNHYTRIFTDNPEEIVYAMLHAGLVY